MEREDIRVLGVGRSFGKNGLFYEIIGRRGIYYMAKVTGVSGHVVCWEIGRVVINRGDGSFGSCGIWESIPSNERFGSGFDRCFRGNLLGEAECYFNSL